MVEPLAPAQLLDVIRADRRRRWLAGDRVPAEVYLHNYPTLASDPACALELVYHEVLLREELGEAPRLDEYLRRFPRLGDQLGPLFEVHQAVEAGGLLETPTNLATLPPTPPGHSPELAAVWPAVPGYEILGCLGHGGMGIVYRAKQLGLNRVVALKMIRAGAEATPDDLARFRVEAEAQARLQHPHVVQVHEIGEANGGPYFALEYVDGGSLEQRLGGKPLPARRAGQLLEAIARAVDHAHRHGLIHRDLKPANVLLAADGTPKVTDFGLVKRTEEESGLSQSGQVVGTPDYMAPEQTTGRRKDVGPAADTYALGAILYTMLTGRPPFMAETPLDTLVQVRKLDPVPPRRLQPKVPRDLETICLKCLQKDPRKRYAGAAALAEDLRRFLAGEPIRARPAGAAERLWRWGRRNPVVASLTAGMAASLLLGTVLSSYFMVKAWEGERRADQKADEAWKESYVASVLAVQTLLEEGNVGACLPLLGQFEEPRPGRRDPRGFEWFYLHRQLHSEMHVMRGHAGEVLNVAFSPDGQTLASAGADGTVRLWDTAEGRELHVLKGHAGWVLGMAFSPDGRRLASAGEDGAVRLWDTASGREVHTLNGHRGGIASVAFSPDGRRLASAGGDGAVRVWDVVGGRELRTFVGQQKGNVLNVTFSVTFSPDGQRIASAGANGVVSVWDVTDGRSLFNLPAHKGWWALNVAFSPDSQLLASAGSDGAVCVWDKDGKTLWRAEDGQKGGQLYTLKDRPGWVSNFAFSPDGQRLAFAGVDETVWLCDAATGQALHTLTGHRGKVLGVVISPDGRRLASVSADGAVWVWDAADGRRLHTLRGHAGRVLSAAFSPDGSRLASAGEDGAVRLWDAAAVQGPTILVGNEDRATGVAFSPDGKRIVSTDWIKPGRTNSPVWLWDTTTGRPTNWDGATGRLSDPVAKDAGNVLGVAFSPDGNRLVLACWDGKVRVWDAAGVRELLSWDAHRGGVESAAFSSDGSRLLTAGRDKKACVWDPLNGQKLQTFAGHAGEVLNAAFSPDGTRAASASRDGTARVWDTATGRELHTLGSRKGYVLDATFSPDGNHLAVAGEDWVVQVWDLAANREVLTLKGHTGYVARAAYSPDGTRLATCGEDKTVRIWDAADGRELLTLRGHTAPVLNLVFSPDGNRLASASADKTVRVWDARPWTAELKADAEAVGLLEFLFAKPLRLEEVRAYLRTTPTIGPAVRDRALHLANIYYAPISDEDYLTDALVTLRQPSWNDSQYRFALLQASGALRHHPGQGRYLTARGMALYRTCQYEDALATLAEADRANRGVPADLAFLAMTHFRLGQTEQALADLTRLRDRVKQAPWNDDGDALLFLREAETLLRRGESDPGP